MKLVYGPTVRVLGRPMFSYVALAHFLEESLPEDKVDSYLNSTYSSTAGDLLPEVAGRICYMSFGNPRPGGNATYLDHIKEVSHGSVLEHPSWSFIIEGVSRSLSHELVRHRAGIAISQLSQRYVDESDVAFVVPPAMADCVSKAWAAVLQRPEPHTGIIYPDKDWVFGGPDAAEKELGYEWLVSCEHTKRAYKRIGDKLTHRAPPELTGTDRRKWARQAARSVLPNCTETKMVWTANTRALRHCIEMRANAAADVEIRALFIEVLKIMQVEAPNLFSDYKIIILPDGTEAAETQWRKV